MIIEKKESVFCLYLKGMSFIHYGDQVSPCRAAQEERLIFRCGGSLPVWRGSGDTQVWDTQVQGWARDKNSFAEQKPGSRNF